jgi:bifunctional non-homologous end joining protein LigD
MMATPSTTLPTGPGWSYEVKWDGYRTLAVKRGDRITLRSRNLKDFTAQYPSVVKTLTTLNVANVILDGEIVALGSDGRPSFQALQHRTASAHALVFYAFDILHLDGRDLLRDPLETRRAILDEALEGSEVLLSTALPGGLTQIVTEVKRLGLEGIVAKRDTSIYEPGRRSDAWIKVRFSLRQEFVIGGYVPDGKMFDSILVGYYDDNQQLLFAGKVRAGFTPALRANVNAQLAALRTARCPFVNLPNHRKSHWGEGVTAEEMTTLKWVKPSVVAEVSFTEWTNDANLRHAAFVALREDKPAREVRREPSSKS